jgi:2'-5' RNA ligase superfamily
MSRTAIVAPFRLPEPLERIRRREVEVARLRVPAHVTILSPFLDSSALSSIVLGRLEAIAESVSAFDVTFTDVRRWASSATGTPGLWLAPDPSEPFVALTRAVWAAYPDAPPYGLPDQPLEAHLTLAIEHPDRFDADEAETRAHLPFNRRADTAALLIEGSGGRWRIAERFPFARGQPDTNYEPGA